jgi:hypothetical protein
VEVTALHGPAHPDAFRVKVGRFGDRWYHDPLPACANWPATDEQWPSVTTIKKAKSKDWSHVSLGRAAAYLATRADELKGLNVDEIHARLLEVNKSGLNRAADRGSSIHHVIEAAAAGQEIMGALVPDAEPYLPAVRAMLDELRPDFLFSEVVSINRTVGYGGTFDAVIRIGDAAYLVDWKTRKPGKHGAYAEEGAQLAAYACADYWIVQQGDQAVRIPPAPLDGLLVVSITPEGHRCYPVI